MPTFLVILAAIVIITLWALFEQRKLAVLDDNINNAMNQIGLQLSNRFDALAALLDIARSYDAHECEILSKSVNMGKIEITAKSTPEDILQQEMILSKALERVFRLSELYPDIKDNQMYIKASDAVQIYENMVRNSRLIYNDSVAKLNRKTRIFPVSILATVLGFRKRDYLPSPPATLSAELNERSYSF